MAISLEKRQTVWKNLIFLWGVILLTNGCVKETCECKADCDIGVTVNVCCDAGVSDAGTDGGFDPTPYILGTVEEYLLQEALGELTPDVVGHWNHGIVAFDSLDYSQAEYFPYNGAYCPNGTYNPGMYAQWIRENEYTTDLIYRIWPGFGADTDYGWPPELMGIAWIYAAQGWVWAAPSIAIIEPARRDEAAYILKNAIKVMRSPAAWMDYAVQGGYGDPMIDNVMWKGPLMIAMGLYALVTRDTETYQEEMTYLARELFEIQKTNLEIGLGNKGFSGLIDCEPNHAFVQCNTWGVMGLLLYDRVYGADLLYGRLIGEEYKNNYMDFIKTQMRDPETGLIYRIWHRNGPMVIDRVISSNTNIYAGLLWSYFDPAFGLETYKMLMQQYLRDDPNGLGAYTVDALPPKGATCCSLKKADSNSGTVVSEATTAMESPSMLGEGGLNLFLAPAAARIYQDYETLEKLHLYLSVYIPGVYAGNEVRYDVLNTSPTGIPNTVTGRVINMFSGWYVFYKAHVGWEAIMNYDWEAE